MLISIHPGKTFGLTAIEEGFAMLRRAAMEAFSWDLATRSSLQKTHITICLKQNGN